MKTYSRELKLTLTILAAWTLSACSHQVTEPKRSVAQIVVGNGVVRSCETVALLATKSIFMVNGIPEAGVKSVKLNGVFSEDTVFVEALSNDGLRDVYRVSMVLDGDQNCTVRKIHQQNVNIPTDEFQKFGFWNGERIKFNEHDGRGYVDQGIGDDNFQFKVDDKKIVKFLSCATKSKHSVYLFGKSNSNGENVVTESYLCVGEIGLGNCSKKKTTCP